MSGQRATGLALAVGARLGSYEILSFVGAGGMGQVYRARDTRLGRVVALKVLSPGTSENRDRRRRFLTEARAVSSLQHANVCTLHDMGSEDGVDFLVMEYVEGETLEARLRRGRLPIRDVLQVGIEIAAALDAAHSTRIVHRDIKPANIMITKSGVKLLDFGLAKSPPRITADAQETNEAPAESTETGGIVGTLHYISPEQLDGDPADTRSDMFAFGAVLFEMATGERAFDGRGSAGIVQSILTHEPPPVSTVRGDDLPVFDRLVQQCLMKDPETRMQSARDVQHVLEWIRQRSADAPSQWPARRRVLLALSTAAIVILGSIAAVAVSRQQVQDAPSTRSTILPPAGSEFRMGEHGTVALSPDGTRLAFAAARDDGTSVLWIRSLRDGSIEALAGTEGAFSPFWSPDSRNLGFFSGGKLKKVAATGGPAQVLCDALSGMGGTWNRNDVIVFAPAPQGFLFQVPASGGDPKELTTADRAIRGEFNHAAPSFLPDGVHFLYTGRSRWSVLGKFQRIYLGSLEGGEPKVLVEANSNALFAPSGHLLYVRDGVLVAHPFDASRGELSGDARPLTGPIRQDIRMLGLANFSISNDGLLVFQEAGQGLLSRLSWVSRSGEPLGTVDSPADYQSLRLSHDGESLLSTIVDPTGQNIRIWRFDFLKGSKTRLTFSSDEDSYPIWSADDQEIFFFSTRPPAYIPDLYRKRLDAGGAEELLLPPHAGVVAVFPSAVSPDGKVVIYSGPAYLNPPARLDLFAYSLEDRKSYPLIGGEHHQYASSFSPDGEWIAYDSRETGRSEIYARKFAGGRTWQVSESGGFDPRWSGDGREIFFQSLDGKIMSVAVTTNPHFEAATPQALFPMRLKAGADGTQYDVARDGQRFILNVPIEEHAPPLTLVQNWMAQLEP